MRVLSKTRSFCYVSELIRISNVKNFRVIASPKNNFRATDHDACGLTGPRTIMVRWKTGNNYGLILRSAYIAISIRTNNVWSPSCLYRQGEMLL